MSIYPWIILCSDVKYKRRIHGKTKKYYEEIFTILLRRWCLWLVLQLKSAPVNQKQHIINEDNILIHTVWYFSLTRAVEIWKCHRLNKIRNNMIYRTASCCVFFLCACLKAHVKLKEILEQKYFLICVHIWKTARICNVKDSQLGRTSDIWGVVESPPRAFPPFQPTT